MANVKPAERVDEKPTEKKGPETPGNLNDLDALKASMLKVEEKLADLGNQAGGAMPRAEFESAWQGLVGQQRDLSKQFAAMLEKMGVIDASTRRKADDKTEEGENVTDWLLGFWA